ncbi:MAG: 3-hydroxyacyl-CoA dehydrogenase/enoyl-CoA hydratase family protein [Rhodospirillaceae bacterium]|nr:3-hydroxyacyl-CoA dehydrogenase/enoyl-CoA hydratase family protein [Rhodospirillaceae bacterium]
MGSSNFFIRKAAVLGTGIMGPRIAAHLANANVPVVLFGMSEESGIPNADPVKALQGLKKQDPGAFVSRSRGSYVDTATYEDNLDVLEGCDLIIEAIIENWDAKEDLYKKIAPHIGPNAILASNTSGLSVNKMAELLPEGLRKNFCGVHFFNPPRHMALVELTPCEQSDPAMLDNLESWMATRLGKSIVRAKDTQSFVANRIGLFSILAVMHHTKAMGLGLDEVDQLTGRLIGRPATATFRTSDMIGLDTLNTVMGVQYATLPDDPWREYFLAPDWFAGLIAKGALGLKTKGGIYRKAGKDITVLDLGTQDYRASGAKASDEVTAIFKIKDPVERFAKLRASDDKHAQFLWAYLRDLFHYAAYHLADIADNVRDVDYAMRWGWAWSAGPFETWQSAGWAALAAAIQEDIDAGKSMAKVALPGWVTARDGVYQGGNAYSPAENGLKGRSSLPVYARQLFPDPIIGETVEQGETLHETGSIRLWRLPNIDSDIAILSFKSKMHSLEKGVVDGIHEAVAMAEADFDGLVVWHGAPFGVGANLAELLEFIKVDDWASVEAAVAHFQAATKALRYAQVPTVAAVEGMAFGGGAEVAMHCAHRVLALESMIGLVEAGVGLIPAGGGCKELVRRASESAMARTLKDPWEDIQKAFRSIIRGATSRGAVHAQEMNFASPCDTVRFNPREVIYVALKQARALADAGHTPPLPARDIKVIGAQGRATLRMDLVNLRDGGFMSPHDYLVSDTAAMVLCGGDVDPGTLVDEDWLLTLERKSFVALAKTEPTQQRMAHMLQTGKPLRN